MPPVWSKPLGDLAQLYQSINQVELDDDFYSRSKSETIKALTYASLALKRMSQQEFNSCDNAFFLSTRNGLILVVRQLTNYVEGVLHAFAKGVHDSEEDRLRKAGFASFTTLRDSTKVNLTQRVPNAHDYPGFLYDEADCRFLPVLLTHNVCSFAEGYLINLLWNRPSKIRQRGEFPVGTNRKGVKKEYGDVALSQMHPGCLYIHSVHEGISLEVHDQKLNAHKEAAKAGRDKENIPPRTQPIESFFSTSKIPSRENPTLTQEQVEEKLEEELFPETLEILFESESKDDLNSMISMLRLGGTEVPDVTDDTYDRLRNRRYNQTASENRRKRAAGEYVPVCPTGAPPVKLTTSQRAVGGRRSCSGENCGNNIQFFSKDGSGEGWCQTCAPANIRSSKKCSHPRCERDKRFDGKCSSHADPANKQYIAHKKREAKRAAENRKKKI